MTTIEKPADTTHEWHKATIERVWYAVRDNIYTEGTRFSDRQAAIDYAKELSRLAHSHNAQTDAIPVRTEIRVDIRAELRFAAPQSCATGVETAVDRFTIDAARWDPTLAQTVHT